MTLWGWLCVAVAGGIVLFGIVRAGRGEMDIESKLRGALLVMVNSFDNGRRKHFHDPLSGRCTNVCQACALVKAQEALRFLGNGAPDA